MWTVELETHSKTLVVSYGSFPHTRQHGSITVCSGAVVKKVPNNIRACGQQQPQRIINTLDPSRIRHTLRSTFFLFGKVSYHGAGWYQHPASIKQTKEQN